MKICLLPYLKLRKHATSHSLEEIQNNTAYSPQQFFGKQF